MTKLVNKIKNMVQRDPLYAVRGPVLQGTRYEERVRLHMHTLMFEIPHGVRIPAQFGYFVEVEASNTNKSRCTIYLTTTEDEEGNPSFDPTINYVDNYTELICRAKVVREVVDKTASPVTGIDVWESNVEHLDEYHSIRTTVYVLEANTISNTEWDNQLNESRPYTITLTNTPPTETGLVVSGSSYTFVSVEEVRCGWYAVRSESMNGIVGYSYETTENYFWPAVLKSGLDFGDLTATRDGVNYIAGILLDYELKNEYSGPCKVVVNVGWSPTDPGVNGVNHMLPTSVQYEGIFVNFTLPKCLHGRIPASGGFTETVATHPVLDTPQNRGPRVWEATKLSVIGGAAVECTDWPASLLGAIDSRPYKGGYLVITKTYYSPNV